MSTVQIGVISLNQTPLDWHGNQRRILEALQVAREQSHSLLCFPELCISGYGCEDAFFSRATQRLSLEVLEEIVAATKGLAICVGLPLVVDSQLYNAAAFVCDQQLQGFVLKRALPKDGIHYEPRWFRPWARGRVCELRIGDKLVPAGDLLFCVDGVRVGIEICEDAWIADRPARSLAAANADIILNPSASHFAFAKRALRESLVLDSSRAYHCAYAYANALGNEAGRIIYDGDSLIASNAQVIARSERFSFKESTCASAVIDIEENRRRRSESAELAEDSLPQSYHREVAISMRFAPVPRRKSASVAAAWESDSASKEQEFTRAVALGLFDYMRKSRSRGFVVSLSGGSDSSAAACLVSASIRLAYLELGAAAFFERLKYFPKLLDCAGIEEVLAEVLTCVYQSTANSSETTRDAAESVAREVGAQYYQVALQPIVDSYVSLLENATGKTLDWASHDTVLQNIQARTRGPFVWMLANDRNALLLATSNRSEAAVGYTTMDGDTCGGLSPIGGIDKAFLLKWLSWFAQGGCVSLGEYSSLQKVLVQVPTAELRPKQAMQSDEQDLMPYVVLDRIERFAIRDRMSPKQVLHELRGDFAEFAEAQLHEWVVRFFRLWSRNQWKRERYAPSFHLDDKNLDPKTWCRFPILSGGFERELAELEELLPLK